MRATNGEPCRRVRDAQAIDIILPRPSVFYSEPTISMALTNYYPVRSELSQWEKPKNVHDLKRYR